jgi:hypothetical protein
MIRDPAKFPSDENGEVLWRLAQNGDDLSIARDIDFSLDFQTEQSALDCGMFLFKAEFKIQLDPPLADEPDSPWTVQVIPYMVPSHAEIGHLEGYLGDVARHYGGDCTGWGCMQQVGGEP